MVNAFKPLQRTQLLAITTANKTYALLGAGCVVRIANVSGQRVRIEFGAQANTAAVKPAGTDGALANAGSLAMADTAVEYFALNANGTNYIAALTDSGAGNIEVTVGDWG
jgi:hypothetical protein